MAEKIFLEANNSSLDSEIKENESRRVVLFTVASGLFGLAIGASVDNANSQNISAEVARVRSQLRAGRDYYQYDMPQALRHLTALELELQDQITQSTTNDIDKQKIAKQIIESKNFELELANPKNDWRAVLKDMNEYGRPANERAAVRIFGARYEIFGSQPSFEWQRFLGTNNPMSMERFDNLVSNELADTILSKAYVNGETRIRLSSKDMPLVRSLIEETGLRTLMQDPVRSVNAIFAERHCYNADNMWFARDSSIRRSYTLTYGAVGALTGFSLYGAYKLFKNNIF